MSKALTLGWPEWFAGLNAATARREGRLQLDTLDRVHRARALIDARCDQPIDLEEMARAACFSRYHFLRQFRRSYGVTPHQYLIEKRIARARELLQESDLSVTEVCFEVGFQSLGSFTNLFRRHVGHPPGRYRAKIFAAPWLGEAAIPSCFFFAYRATAE